HRRAERGQEPAVGGFEVCLIVEGKVRHHRRLPLMAAADRTGRYLCVLVVIFWRLIAPLRGTGRSLAGNPPSADRDHPGAGRALCPGCRRTLSSQNKG